MKTKHKFKTILFLGVIACLLLLGYVTLPAIFSQSYSSAVKADESITDTVNKEIIAEAPIVAPVEHIETPESVKAIYMTACAAGTPSFRTNIVSLLDQTELNAVIIDVKDFSGTLSIPSENPLLASAVGGKGCKVKDMKDFVATLHAKDVYVIARVTVFQDPLYATLHPNEAIKRISDGKLWADKNGLNYLYPGSESVWNYIVAIAEESYAMGFDEINFDYIRFPSDGDIKNMAVPAASGLTKADIIENFFSYLNSRLKDTGMVTSADLFGMTTTNRDDLGIGQVLERTLPYFDYVAPMVYPSHYPKGFNGWSNPNSVPYELIRFVMQSAVERTTALKNDVTQPEWLREKVSPDQLRPWLQNFSLGQPPYGANEIAGQIKATHDVGLDSWFLWDASNKYTNTKAGLSL